MSENSPKKRDSNGRFAAGGGGGPGRPRRDAGDRLLAKADRVLADLTRLLAAGNIGGLRRILPRARRVYREIELAVKRAGEKP